VYKQLLMAFVFASSACAPAAGQASGVPHPVPPDSPAEDETLQPSSWQLRGILISESNRTALFNSQQLREGDQLGGAKILAIDHGGVRVRVGVREVTVDVGGTIASSVPSGERRSPRPGVDVRHAVQAGETLSGIALKYRLNDVTANQMMIALFQANPQAFDDNINVLHEGAILRIPDEHALHHHAPETATAEVARHTERWQAAYARRTRVARLPSEKHYGPVKSGETLSGIAFRHRPSGVTPNQMIMALFQANPQAFDDNINVLHEGAILRIPDEHALPHHAPQTATAEVLRQTKVWLQRQEQHAALALALAHNSVRAPPH